MERCSQIPNKPYDSSGRVDEISETIEAGQTNKVKFAYDNLGRVSSKTYTNSNNVSYVESYVYNSYGFLDQVKFNNTLAYKVTAMDTRGNITTAHIGGANAFWGYNPQGVLTSISATNVQSFSYNFDLETGNLLSRTDRLRSKSETFLYDNLDRLTSASRTGATLSMGYDNKGNLTSKSDAGTLVYDNGSPYQLAHVNPYSSAFPTNTQEISYTSYGQVNTITDGAYGATFKYNSDMQRVKMASTLNGSATKTKYYFGSSYKKEVSGTTTTEYIWIGGDAYSAVAVAKIVNNGTPQVWGIFRDHLGSITHIKNGLTVQEYSYDAWGRRRDKDTWSYSVDDGYTLFADRGFTGHEHLTEFGLINMNGRLYDPLVGRFLSPDNYVQDASNTQNFNRYGYCLNNPLRYTDPDGEFIFTALLGPVGVIIDAACWGAVIGGAGYTANVAFSDGGFNNWNWGQFGKSVGVGAISGAVTGGVGQMFGPVGSMGFGGEIARAYTHGFAQGMVSEFTGGDFMTGFAAGGLGSLAGSSFMMYGGKFASSTFGTYAFSGLAGGVGAELTGGNFWQGAAVGVMNAGLNHLQSVVGEAGARYYANKKAGYGDMWDNSFVNGKATREVSAWELENGDMIMLPYDKNDLTTSYNDALKVVNIDGKRYVQFNGKNYALATHAHTHPSMAGPNAHPIGLSRADLDMQAWTGRPINILYNKGIYSVNGTYNYKAKVWNYKYTGTW